jgi:hypothetical protein
MAQRPFSWIFVFPWARECAGKLRAATMGMKRSPRIVLRGRLEALLLDVHSTQEMSEVIAMQKRIKERITGLWMTLL